MYTVRMITYRFLPCASIDESCPGSLPTAINFNRCRYGVNDNLGTPTNCMLVGVNWGAGLRGKNGTLEL